MPHSYGYRARTRSLFRKKFRSLKAPNTTKMMTIYKVGDIVDIVADPSTLRGMPHKYYQGRTGIVWNVNPRSVGVIINKQVRERILEKRIHVRTEHVRHSKCRDDFVKRCKDNTMIRRVMKGLAPEAKGCKKPTGIKAEDVPKTPIRRLPEQPLPAEFISKPIITNVAIDFAVPL